MLISQIVMIALLYYQVTMPSVLNAKYSMINKDGQIVRMNTQDGSMEVCNDKLECKPLEKIEEAK